jgi:RES domain-containing protein
LRSDGRWHERGTAVFYTATTPSLCALEYLVHVDPDVAPTDLVLLEINVPDAFAIEDADPAALSPDWRLSPSPTELRAFGTTWVRERRSPLLRVPSALLPVGAEVEANVLVNPALLPPDFTLGLTRRFSFDARLL